MSKYDFIERARLYSVSVRSHIRSYKYDSLLVDDFRQLIRSSGAIGANYIEANQCLGSKDFKLRAKIAKKEAKESAYWSAILYEITGDEKFRGFQKESTELELILGGILKNYKE